MAHKKGQSSSRNGRDSNPKFLGIKAFGGESVSAGSIIVRQRGTKFHAGENVGVAAIPRFSRSATAPSSSARRSARSASFRFPPSNSAAGFAAINQRAPENSCLRGFFVRRGKSNHVCG